LIRIPPTIYHSPFLDFVSFLPQTVFQLRRESGKIKRRVKFDDLSGACAEPYDKTSVGVQAASALTQAPDDLRFGDRAKQSQVEKSAFEVCVENVATPIHFSTGDVSRR